MINTGKVYRCNKIISPCLFLVFTITCVLTWILVNYNTFSALWTPHAYVNEDSHQIGNAALNIHLAKSNYKAASISVMFNDREIESFAVDSQENLNSISKQGDLKRKKFKILVTLEDEKLAEATKKRCIKDADEIEISDLNIFFIESTCGVKKAEAAITESNGIFLDARQACAIESAAFMNPNHSVYLLYTCALDEDPLEVSTKVVKRVLSYSNLYIVPISMDRYFKGTPLEKLYKRGDLEGSQFPVVHVSDVLRLLTLWKYGGTYIDLDTVVMRPIEDLGSNYIGLQQTDLPNNAVINFAHHGFSHDHILTRALNFLNTYFDNRTWSANGQYLIMDTLGAVCNATTMENIMIWGCNGFKIYPTHYFYAVEYFMSPMFFRVDKKNADELRRRLKDSYIAHMWASDSKVYKIVVGSEQPYAKLAQKHCPRVYSSRTVVF